MRILGVFLLTLVALAIMGGARYYYVCHMKGRCAGGVGTDSTQVDEQRLSTLTLRTDSSILLQGYDQFAFDTAAISPRLNRNNLLFLDSVAAYLKADTSRRLALTGRYRPTETGRQSGFFENLGLARADAVRQLLQDRGIDGQRMTLDHEPTRDAALLEPIDFRIFRPAAQPESYEQLQFTFTNMTFSDANFAHNSDVFLPGEPFKRYADSVRTYLSLHPAKVLTIVGHTDSDGADDYNLDLGLRRAKSARTYFEELGVTNEIAVESEGESRPTATNKTPEGKQKNRRVNFVLQ